MTNSSYEYPQPVRSPDNAAYLDGWEDGKLMLQHCDACDKFIFFPRAMCPTCWNENLSWKEACGRGAVASYTLIYRPNHPSFNSEVPIVLAEVLLDEGVSMFARILNDTPKTGMKVTLYNNMEIASSYPLPVFKLDVK